MPNLSRRHLVTAAAALPALTMPAVAATLALEPDPILAAIERHRRACAETDAAWARLTALEEDANSTEEQCFEQEDKATDALRRKDNIALGLLHIQPTTVAGAAAVLSYYTETEAPGEQAFPENLDDDGNRVDAADISVYDSPPEFGYLLARNVAHALAQIMRVSPWSRDENGIPTRTVGAVLPRRSFLLKEARSHDDHRISNGKDRRQPDDALCPADWEVWS